MRSKAREMRWTLMTKELTAWKMRSGLMICVQMKQVSRPRNKKLDALHQLNILDCGVLMCKLPDPVNLFVMPS
jgi:hypothetical protein